MFQQQRPTPPPNYNYAGSTLTEHQRKILNMASAPPAVYDTPQPQQPQQQRGFNKHLRDSSKLLLGVTALCLFAKYNGCAVLSSSTALYVMKRGTLLSTKNLKWLLLAVLSFLIATMGYAWQEGADVLQSTYRYRYSNWKLITWFCAEFIQVFWSVVLAFFVISAFTSKLPNHVNGVGMQQTVAPSYTANTGINPHYKQE